MKEEYELVEKPNLATILSGGITIGFVLIYILGRALRKWEYILYLQIAIGVIILLISFQAGREVDTFIRFNTLTGAAYARDRSRYWEGNIRDTSIFQVLEREKEVGDEMIKEYKLYIGLSDDTFYQVKLKSEEVTELIQAVEQAKHSTEM